MPTSLRSVRLTLAAAGLVVPAVALHAQAAPQLLAVADTTRPRPAHVSAEPAPGAKAAPAEAVADEEELSPDRPGSMTGPALLARGRRQVETGYSYARAGAEHSQAVGEVLLRAAVSPAVELRLGLNSFELAAGPEGRASGFDDAVVGTKLRLARGGDGPSLHPAAAMIVGTSLPSGGRTFGHHHSEPQATVAAEWTTPRETAVTVNVGAARRDAGAGVRTDEYLSGAAFAWPLGHHLRSYLEYSTSWSAEPGSAAQEINTGVTLVPGHVFQLDTWTAVELRHGAPEYHVGFGLVRRW